MYYFKLYIITQVLQIDNLNKYEKENILKYFIC